MISDENEIIATAFGTGRTHDFRLFKESATYVNPETMLLADSGYQGLQKLHSSTDIPKKATKKHSLTKTDKARNHELSSRRIFVEHAIRRVKVFRIIKETYRNRRRRFGLRFNLIAAVVNMEWQINHGV